MERLDNSLVSVSQDKSYTKRDIVLSKVKKYIMQGWPENITSKEITPYKQRKDELSVEDGCLLWGTRVIIPHKLRQHVLQEIHEGHPGIVKIKCFARSYVWWPSLNIDPENQAHECIKRQQEKGNASSKTNASMGVAREAMDATTCGSCRTIYE